MLETTDGSVTGKLDILFILAPALLKCISPNKTEPAFPSMTHKIFLPLLLVTSPGWFPPLCPSRTSPFQLCPPPFFSVL